MYIQITRNRVIILIALIVAAGAGLLLNWLIVTDKDRVKMTLNSLAAAVEKNDADALMPLFDDSFRLGGMNAQEFRAWYADILKGMRVKKVSQYDATVEIDKNDPATAIATVQAFVVLDNPASESRVDWRLELRKRGDKEWKIVSIRAYWPINGAEIPLTGIRNLLSF